MLCVKNRKQEANVLELALISSVTLLYIGETTSINNSMEQAVSSFLLKHKFHTISSEWVKTLPKYSL